VVELARDGEPDAGLADRIRERLRGALVFSAAVELVPFGTLERSEYKSKLVRH
jgi:phenylacetate-CoA ligase